MEETVLICEDTMEGILTGVYEAYALRRPHERIRLQVTGIENYRLFAVYCEVTTDTCKSGKVLRTIFHRLGEDAFTKLCQAMVSFDSAKADAVYHTIVTGLSGQYRGKLMDHLSLRHVHKVFCLSRNTANEINHQISFLRFQELQGGVLLARYAPKNDITTMLMPHFADRLPKEDFAIYDEKRQYYAVHPKDRQWYLVRGELPFEEEAKVHSREEGTYRQLFSHFCRTIAVEERKNPKLQRNLLPLWMRRHMTEFQKS